MKSIFEYNPLMRDALERVNYRMEAASKENVDLFGQVWFKKHFRINPVPHIRGEFDTMLGAAHITIAASTINGRSLEPLRAKGKLAEVRQKMFTHAHAYKLTADEILNLKDKAEILKKNGGEQGEAQAVKFLTDELYNYTQEAVNGVYARLDYIILSALSNEGKHAVTSDNDPQSPFAGLTMDFGLPAANCAVVGENNEWYDPDTKQWNTELQATLDPIKEINDVLKKSRKRMQTILLDEDTLEYIMGCAKLKTYLNNQLTFPNEPIDIVKLNAYMKAHQKPTFEVVYREIDIQDGDEVTTQTPWRTAQLVFLPSNEIGTIETKFTEKERGIQDDEVKYANVGRVELHRMAYGEKEASEYYELLKARITAAPSFVTFDQVLTLDTTK